MANGSHCKAHSGLSPPSYRPCRAHDKDGRPSVCPRCSNEELNGEYCKICGTYIVNKCSAETDLDLNGNEY
ncbi:MAG TPA: hypothetical protein VFC74_01695, partial [Oscillospiraceae bacterium]|nr:hypothetical protein [Oscillospiraceae bacterium]